MFGITVEPNEAVDRPVKACKSKACVASTETATRLRKLHDFMSE